MSLYLGDEPSPGLVALTVGSPFLLLLQDTLPAGAVLQGELPQQLADGRHLHIPRCACWVPQVQQEGVKPAGMSVTVVSPCVRTTGFLPCPHDLEPPTY